MKIAELSGPLLDYWVGRTVGVDSLRTGDGGTSYVDTRLGIGVRTNYSPSTDWAQGGPIIERAKIDIQCGGWEWGAWRGSNPDWEPAGDAFGDSPLIAAMRAFVGSKLGDEVPDEVAREHRAPLGSIG